MKPLTHLALFFMVIGGGCAIFQNKETRFLARANHHATQAEVQQQMGPPALVQEEPSGESLWTYRIFAWQPGSRATAPGTWCDEYVLTFDPQHVLRSWTHRNYFHGGEAFPTSCVPNRKESVSRPIPLFTSGPP